MNELIKITYHNEEPAVSARELHEFLEVSTRFNDWFLRMCEYGFVEGEDYYSFLSNRSDGLPGKPRKDAALTLDTAKEICMLQRNEKGRQARRYFIQLEKDWNSPEKLMARALVMAMQISGRMPAFTPEVPAIPDTTPAPPMIDTAKPLTRMRSIPQAVAELKARDPGTNITVCILRRWVKEGKIKHTKTGKNFIVNMDDLEEYLRG